MNNTYKFLNVGFGDTSILYIEDKIIMVDCFETEGYGDRIIDHIPGGVVDVLILTHRHYDHYFGIEILLENAIIVNEIWESPWIRKENDQSIDLEQWNRCQSLVDKLVERGAKSHFASKSKQAFLEIGDCKFYSLNPEKSINENLDSELHDGCLVVRMSTKQNSNEILFLGDTCSRVLERLSTEGIDLKTKILCSSHHGGLDSANVNFIKCASPDYTVVSSQPGITPGIYGTIPEDEALKIYATYTKKAMKCTFIEGTILL